jgi:2',3'-cyclic-nucleotide 2'-phosphodiesterase (5'-nucleotidase family)
MKESGIDPLILDAGDIFFSSSNINDVNRKSEMHRAQSIIDGYDKIGCDVINVGHYETLNGLKFFRDIEKRTDIPFISSNLKDSKTNELILDPYATFQRDGLRIGVVGVTDNLPDTSKQILADDYIEAGNKYINLILKKVDIVVLLVNCERGKQSSLASDFPDVDFIVTSGSTNMTRGNTPQEKNGPQIYSCGKQGKYLVTLDIELKDKNKPFIDVSAEEKKLKQISKRFERLQKKDPSKTLEDLYADQSNVLKLIEGYKKDEITSKNLIESSVNKLKYKTIGLSRKVPDDPEMLKFVNSSVETCALLKPKSKKKNILNNKAKTPPRGHSNHDGHNH